MTDETHIIKCQQCGEEYPVPTWIETATCHCGGCCYYYKRGKPVIPKGKLKKR